MKLNEYRLKNCSLCLLVVLELDVSEDEFLDALALFLRSGVQMLVLRAGLVSARTVVSYCKKIRELCSFYNVIFVLDSRTDIAQIVDADGVQFGKNDVEPLKARIISSDEMVFGLSNELEMHENYSDNEPWSLKELLLVAQQQRVDYVLVDSCMADKDNFCFKPDVLTPVFAKIKTIEEVKKIKNLGITKFAVEANFKNAASLCSLIKELFLKLK